MLTLLALSLVGLTLAAESYWWTQPVVLDLTPAGPHYIERHRQLMDLRTSGMGANPAFRQPWTRMDAHWAMIDDGDLTGVYIAPEEAERYRDLAVVAATVAAQDLLHETVDRSDVLRGMRVAVRSVTSPSLMVRKNEYDHTEVRANQARGMQNNNLIAASIAEPNCPVEELSAASQQSPRDQQSSAYGQQSPRPPQGQAPARRRPTPLERPTPKPAFNVGFAGGVNTAVGTDDMTSGEPATFSLTVAWSAYMQARNVAGIDVLRLSGNVMEWQPLTEGDEPVTTGAWMLSARERFLPRWTGVLDARSVGGQVALDAVRPGVAWQVFKTNPRWYLQTNYTHGLVTEARPEALHTAQVRLLWTSRWSAPSAPDRWPLGLQPGASGPVWPEDPEPINQVVELIATPAERNGDLPTRAGQRLAQQVP